tara:strand:+ start:2059 stop:2589 length:531 start_codon:yes stop_codon:yes gene_type:complete
MAQDPTAPDETPDQDYSRTKGGQALGARLRRLSERLDRDGTRIYAVHGVVFEQRWFGVLNQLILKGSSSVGDLAATMRITHVSVSQSCRSLEKAGIIRSVRDPADARRRTLTLTPDGQALVTRLTPLWDAFNAAAAELNDEADNAVAALDRLDDALARRSLFDRINDRLDTSPRTD